MQFHIVGPRRHPQPEPERYRDSPALVAARCDLEHYELGVLLEADRVAKRLGTRKPHQSMADSDWDILVDAERIRERRAALARARRAETRSRPTDRDIATERSPRTGTEQRPPRDDDWRLAPLQIHPGGRVISVR